MLLWDVGVYRNTALPMSFALVQLILTPVKVLLNPQADKGLSDKHNERNGKRKPGRLVRVQEQMTQQASERRGHSHV